MLRIAASRARSPMVAASASADSNAETASPPLSRVARASPSRASSSPLESPRERCRSQHDAPRLRGLVERRALEDQGDAGPHLRFGDAVFELREELRRLLQTRQRLLVPREAEERVAEHPQRLHQTFGVPRRRLRSTAAR